jgi:hypothetical protein
MILAVDNRYRYIIALMLCSFALLCSISIVNASSWNGGLSSEKMVSRSGVTNSNLSISAGTESTVIGLSGIVTTGIIDNIYIDVPKLDITGTVTDMNGFPTARAYFDWGYTSACGNESSSDTVSGVGDYTITLTDFNRTQTIYYRAAIDTDGTNYGEVLSYVPTGNSAGVNLIRTLMPLLVVIFVIIGLLTFSFKDSIVMNIVLMGIYALLGTAFIKGILAFIDSMF